MNVDEMKLVLSDQKESLLWLGGGRKIIERENLPAFSQLINSTLIKVISGPRRAGKSVISLHLLKEKKFAYVNFDDERLTDISSTDLNMLMQAIYEIYDNPKYIHFNEIQNIKGWELFVNRLKRSDFNLIITGSNAKLLSSELVTHLTGRHITLELLPFSFREYLDFHGIDFRNKNYSTKEIALIKKSLTNYLLYGGFPEIVQGEYPKRYLLSLFSTILSRDILSRKNIKYSKVLRDTAFYLLSNCGCRQSFNKIKNLFGFKSVHTAENYYQFLEETYIVFAVNRYSCKVKERLNTPRKIYAIDPGLITAIAPKPSMSYGVLYENIVAIELKRNIFKDDNIELYYWTDNLNHEVDFLVKEKGRVTHLIQVSYDISNPDTLSRETRALIKASKETGCKKLFIITGNEERIIKIEDKSISVIPLWKWLIKNKVII